MSEIKLIDVLKGLEKENFTKRFPGRRRKLCFNVNWRAPAVDAESFPKQTIKMIVGILKICGV